MITTPVPHDEATEGYDLLLGHVAAHCCQGAVMAGSTKSRIPTDIFPGKSLGLFFF